MDLPEPSGSGRGIVYVGGDGPGMRSSEYGLQAAVGIRMARRVGWDGSIEWWFDSRVESVKQYLTPDMGEVRVRDFADYHLRYSVTWWKKLAAIALSDFEQLIFLDADAYMVHHPQIMFSLLQECGFAFWSKNDQWAKVDRICPGIDIGGRKGTQGGQLAIDRKRAWRLVVIAHWMGQHADYYGAEKKHKQVRWHQFGDEDCWSVGRGLLKHYGYPQDWIDIATVTPSPTTHRFSIGSTPVVVHRCNDKMHSSGWMSSLPFAPMDKEACEELEEAIRGRERNAVGAPQGWRYRKLTWDLEIFRQVATNNEYEIGDLEGGSVLDVGGNTGCFAWLAKQHGAGRIVSVEPHPDNFVILNWNCGSYATCCELALWGIGGDGLTLQDHYGGNTGTARLGNGTIPVKVESFDSFVEREFGDESVRLLKLDCEGAEIPILLESERLGQFEEIKAEIHAGSEAQWYDIVGQIRRRLAAYRFTVTKEALHIPDAGQGHLFLRKENT
jgi:FkbM family methyltransferase